MNKIYCQVWSAAAGGLVAVSEHTRRAGKRSGGTVDARSRSSFSTPLMLRLLPLLLALAHSASSWALPQDGQVAAGTGTIAQSATSMTVTQSSSKLAINWSSFGIDAGQSVTFAQPSASAKVATTMNGEGNDCSHAIAVSPPRTSGESIANAEPAE